MFSKYKGGKIALYGLGTETQRILRELGNSYEIVGLLDSFRTDGELYGKQIISFEDALNADIKLIIVVARPGSCRAITKKIENRCRKEGIALMDIRGRNLLETKKVSYIFSDVYGVTKAELEEKIKDADVVSFDLFDTLVMRRTLYSDDVVEYVDCLLREKGIVIEDFCRERLGSEKELSGKTAPALIEIYQHMLKKMSEKGSVESVTAEDLADLEWNVDYDLLVPRKEVCDIFRETAAKRKKVYVISDTYYSKDQLMRILEMCGITGYTDILTSSDYRTGKMQGLYEVLKDRENAERYLHIGDDVVADIESAGNCGFETCRLFSGLDLLELLGSLGFLEYMNSLSDHLKIGMFVSRIFNSPFQFENGNADLEMKDAYDIGYLLCAPVISDFVCWFHERMEEYEFPNIWFGARDGYLIKKMYGYLLESLGKKDETVYFLTSRIAAVRAGVRDIEDIRYVDQMKFSGTLEENLKERFGIDIGGTGGRKKAYDEGGLIGYKDVILESSRNASTNYCKYIESLNVKKGDIAFFDFVAKGTTQMFVQRLTDNHLKGFYFLQPDAQQMKDKELDICSFCADGNGKSVLWSGFFDDYYILETLVTAPYPSLMGFDENGFPAYAPETRRDKDIFCLRKAQEGIIDYFKTYIRLCRKGKKTISRNLDAILLGLIHKVKITDEDFLGMVVEDPFFNRMTDITDVL